MFKDLYKETFSQVTASDSMVQEVLNLKNKRRSAVRVMTLVAAVMLIVALATTAFAYAGFVVYENPRQMLDALFGASIEQEHEGKLYVDDQGQERVDPGYQREELNEEAAEEYVAPHIFEVGQTVSYGGNTLTVDAASYDPNTQCGIVYVHLDNPDGVPGYYLQTSGELTWNGQDVIRSKKLGVRYFLDAENSGDTSLSLAGYFYMPDYMDEAVLTLRVGESEDITIPMEGVTPMEQITLGNGGIQLSPIGLVIHGDKLDLLNGGWETRVDTVTIRYADGSEYLVKDDTGTVPIVNCAAAFMEPGDGYETDRYCVTYLLNRIVPLDQVTDVIVDGVSYSVDQ